MTDKTPKKLILSFWRLRLRSAYGIGYGKVEEYVLLRISEYWIVDYRGLGGVAFIGKPKQPTFTVCQLMGEEYQQTQYRLGQPIHSPLLANFQLGLEDILPR